MPHIISIQPYVHDCPVTEREKVNRIVEGKKLYPMYGVLFILVKSLSSAGTERFEMSYLTRSLEMQEFRSKRNTPIAIETNAARDALMTK